MNSNKLSRDSLSDIELAKVLRQRDNYCRQQYLLDSL
jgi:hypothetical protein